MAGTICSGVATPVERKLDPAGARCVLQRLKPARSDDVRIVKCRDTTYSGHPLHQDFLPLAIKLGGKDAHAGRIAAGLDQRPHQSLPDHVVSYGEDRNRCFRPLCGVSGNIPAAHNDINLGFDQLHRMFRELLDTQIITLRINHKVLALDEAEPSQLLEECEMMRCVAWT